MSSASIEKRQDDVSHVSIVRLDGRLPPPSQYVCHKDGYQYIRYSLEKNGVCIYRDRGPYLTKSCFGIDKSLTAFKDHPYSFPRGATSTGRRNCATRREIQEIPEFHCIPDRDAPCISNYGVDVSHSVRSTSERFMIDLGFATVLLLVIMELLPVMPARQSESFSSF
ncbi:hypothetical protein BB560_001141 [Smittium megazygosporum]|uniref:Uncharacterized protein n=1 Tax=Smittium megazygosporum TaxID=133381 RepID=A0A2T9ZIH2_9FUNG|nr:hypothetical protein BB560_001141 [Smittium megazygosporum]